MSKQKPKTMLLEIKLKYYNSAEKMGKSKYTIALKLTPVQNKVLWCLQNGFSLITVSEHKGAVVGHLDGRQFQINNGVFWRLVGMDIIYQTGSERRFCYHLTEWKGEKLITKEPKDI